MDNHNCTESEYATENEYIDINLKNLNKTIENTQKIIDSSRDEIKVSIY